MSSSSNGSDGGDEPVTKGAKVTSERVPPDKQMMNNLFKLDKCHEQSSMSVGDHCTSSSAGETQQSQDVNARSLVSAMDEGDVRPVLGKVVAALQTDENLGKYETLFKTQQPSSACNNWGLRSKLERWTSDPRWRRRSDGKTREFACKRPKVIC